MSFERWDGINFLEGSRVVSKFELLIEPVFDTFPSYLLSPQVKKTLYTFWILKVTLRDKTNSNSNCGPQNQCDLRGVLYYAVRLARKSLIILAKIFRLFRSSIF